jgi:phosphohistidine phosphatase
MRHAKSASPGDVSDADRPLSGGGKEDAAMMGRYMRTQGRTLDHAVSSTALRARETALLLCKELGYDGPIDYLPSLYEASGADVVASLHVLPFDAASCLVVGHNPTMEDVVLTLTGARRDAPTGTIAEIHLRIDDWAEARAGEIGALVNFWRPREVAPVLAALEARP